MQLKLRKNFPVLSLKFVLRCQNKVFRKNTAHIPKGRFSIVPHFRDLTATTAIFNRSLASPPYDRKQTPLTLTDVDRYTAIPPPPFRLMTVGRRHLSIKSIIFSPINLRSLFRSISQSLHRSLPSCTWKYAEALCGAVIRNNKECLEGTNVLFWLLQGIYQVCEQLWVNVRGVGFW